VPDLPTNAGEAEPPFLTSPELAEVVDLISAHTRDAMRRPSAFQTFMGATVPTMDLNLHTTLVNHQTFEDIRQLAGTAAVGRATAEAAEGVFRQVNALNETHVPNMAEGQATDRPTFRTFATTLRGLARNIPLPGGGYLHLQSGQPLPAETLRQAQYGTAYLFTTPAAPGAMPTHQEFSGPWNGRITTQIQSMTVDQLDTLEAQIELFDQQDRQPVLDAIRFTRTNPRQNQPQYLVNGALTGYGQPATPVNWTAQETRGATVVNPRALAQVWLRDEATDQIYVVNRQPDWTGRVTQRLQGTVAVGLTPQEITLDLDLWANPNGICTSYTVNPDNTYTAEIEFDAEAVRRAGVYNGQVVIHNIE
jgi:hypothetical protein